MAHRLVVADDDASMRRLLRILVELDDDFEVIGEATCGSEALEQVDALDPDILILDLEMPEMDGKRVLEVLGDRDRPQVVVVTAHDDEIPPDADFRSGAADWIEKGDELVDINEHLRQVCGDA
jgi:two-component system, NarL family, invasion response regulator UvrY